MKDIDVGVTDRRALALRYASLAVEAMSEKDPAKLARIAELQLAIKEGLGLSNDDIVHEAAKLAIRE